MNPAIRLTHRAPALFLPVLFLALSCSSGGGGTEPDAGTDPGPPGDLGVTDQGDTSATDIPPPKDIPNTDGQDVVEPVPVTVTITPGAGGTVETEDKRISVEFPAGAVPADTEVTITPLPDRLGIRLEPDGLQLAKPATVTFQLEASDFPGIAEIENAMVLSFPVMLGSGGGEVGQGTVEVPNGLVVSRDFGSPSWKGSVDIDHFSILWIEGWHALEATEACLTAHYDYQETHTVGKTFSTTVNGQYMPVLFSEITQIGNTYVAMANKITRLDITKIVLEIPDGSPVASTGINPFFSVATFGPDEPGTFQKQPQLTCVKEGTGDVVVKIEMILDIIIADEQSLQKDELSIDRVVAAVLAILNDTPPPEATYLSVLEHKGVEERFAGKATFHCVPPAQVEIKEGPNITGEAPHALVALIQALTEEGREGGVFGLDPAVPHAAIAHKNGVNIHDLTTGAAVFTDAGAFNRFGALILRTPDADFLADYGAEWGATIRKYSPESEGFGMAQIYPGDHVTDGWTPVDAVGPWHDLIGFTVYNSNVIQFRTYDAGMTNWVDSDPLFTSMWTDGGGDPPQGSPISAQSDQAGHMIVAFTNEPTPEDQNPGELWFFDPDGPAGGAKKVGALGVKPRKIRCLNGICFVTNFGDGTVTILDWKDTSKAPTVLGTEAVGDGPVGVSLDSSPGGSIFALTTGQNDNTYTILTTDPDGAKVTNSTHPLTNCQGPGYAEFLNDKQFLVTCNTDSHYIVVTWGQS